MKEKLIKKKEAIIIASRDLFAINGYENTKVEDITRSINISKGSFYTYFKTKEDVLFEVIEKLYSEYGEKLESIDKSQDQKKILKEFFKVRILIHMKYGNIKDTIIELLLSEVSNQKILSIRDRIVLMNTDFIKNNIIMRYNKKGIDEDFTADFIERSISGYFISKVKFSTDKKKIEKELYSDEVFDKITKFIDDSLSKK